MSRTTALILAPTILGTLLAFSNWRLIRENRRLGEQAQFYASLRHTPEGILLPGLHGKGLDGRDLTISYGNVNQETLLFVFSPTCPHCKRNWPVWLDLARQAAGKRVVFVNAGGPLPPHFGDIYSFDSRIVLADTSPESILRYSFFETPLTILVSPQGRCEKVWAGELGTERAQQISSEVTK